MGVDTLGYPSGLAGPALDSDVARVTDALTTADATAISTTGSNEPVISRQPPTVADTTAAASRSPTHLVATHIPYIGQWPLNGTCRP